MATKELAINLGIMVTDYYCHYFGYSQISLSVSLVIGNFNKFVRAIFLIYFHKIIYENKN